MWKELLILEVIILLLIPAGQSVCVSSSGCSSPEVADSVERLQAALMKQVLAEYGVNGNLTCKIDPLLYKLLNQTAATTAANRDSIRVLNKTLADILHTMSKMTTNNDYTPSQLLHSCEEIKSQFPDSPSDYYIIADGTGHARHVYCQMEQVCGSSGWMRVAYLNMSDPTEECPSGFRLYNQNGVRACGRQVTSGGSCQSVRFPSYNITYSNVCGQVYGYQKGTPDAVVGSSVNGIYADGVSLTHGKPRQHIWSFIAGQQENFIHLSGHVDCPCANGSAQTSPSSVGNDYFCESGAPGRALINSFYFSDYLWDGEQCGHIEGGCCQAPGLPWFHKTLPSPSSDYIELRICCNQGTVDEDVPVGFYEIYAK